MLNALASLRLTALAFVALACGVLIAYHHESDKTWPMVLPLLLLAGNLFAAILTRPIFRKQVPLLVFHLALLVLIVLVAAGRASYLKGWVKLADGEAFAGVLGEVENGPWHRNRLSQVHFSSAGFEIEYRPGMNRGRTLNRVRHLDDRGLPRESIIGDQTPLILEGYRFYTTSNKGFAPTFLWIPKNGSAQLGTLMLPSFPLNEFNQSIDWHLPDSERVLWIGLILDEVAVDPERDSLFRLPVRHRLVIRTGDSRHELLPGSAVEFPEGRLIYQELRTWMGYAVFSDWTIPWMLACCALGLGGLALHFWSKFRASPWRSGPDD